MNVPTTSAGAEHSGSNKAPTASEASRTRAGSVMRMVACVHRAIMHSIAAQAPETGGILLGPADSDSITGFYHDAAGSCTVASYSPDCPTLNRLLKEQWEPAGLRFVGFAHSHPHAFVRPSAGDLDYIRRIFSHNPRMTTFAAPIVIPSRFWLRPFVVTRSPFRVIEAELEVIDHIPDPEA